MRFVRCPSFQILSMYIHMCASAQLLQACPTLCNPTDCSPLGSSVHGILPARILQRLLCPSQGIFPTQGWNPCLLHAGRFFTVEPPGKPYFPCVHICRNSAVWFDVRIVCCVFFFPTSIISFFHLVVSLQDLSLLVHTNLPLSF